MTTGPDQQPLADDEITLEPARYFDIVNRRVATFCGAFGANKSQMCSLATVAAFFRFMPPNIGHQAALDESAPVAFSYREQSENRARIVPLYEARIEDLGPGDFLRVECAACGHDALIHPSALPRLQFQPSDLVLGVEHRLRCRECDAGGKAVVSITWGETT